MRLNIAVTFLISWWKEASIEAKTGCLILNVKKGENDSGQWACSGKQSWKKLLLNSLLKCYSPHLLFLSSHLVSLSLALFAFRTRSDVLLKITSQSHIFSRRASQGSGVTVLSNVLSLSLLPLFVFVVFDCILKNKEKKHSAE